MKITIYDVADKAGVSITTVSRVINNTGRISDKTRQKVLRVMEEMDYLPNVHASALTGKRTNIIGLITPDISNPFFGELAKSIEDSASLLGFHIMICSTDYHPEKETKYFSMLKQKKADGIIVATGIEHADSIKALDDIVKSGIPLAMISQDRLLVPMDVVIIDDFLGGYSAAKHLLSLGHKKIACITGDGSTTSEKDRMKGFQEAMREAGTHLDESLIIPTRYSLESGKKAAGALFDRDLPTAVFAFNDVLSCAVIQAARLRGIRVPEDLSIIGFDNTILAEMVDPPLTTMAQPIHEMGRRVVQLLIDEIQGKKKTKSKIILSPELVVRQSTAPAKTRP
ncbi:LacI family DNA-binding transcriptional regulator [Bacillus sp. ISL-51]|uniref:LacI family DNA-binding transcriptional regulator n=1 Tax=Bacteria TaxID=2 RepID=UPI001BEBF6E0|nr:MULTISPECIES: LacI family DNA-binding transcriptional regulator [Bacteria]MBT2573871.1 LacI family DNA-binding transcriptional regulator [Bacillus sp. ISL-51]MBT2634797.1 LacI family DNA-binding transcriptional regulator [Bacillus sp. ISL-26]MBT2712273.1 LacI family DNA-binding transcriptional regulator [Pseudomonas sp. ISL-88]